MFIARLIRLDAPSGPVRMSTLPADWTDPEGATWIGGGAVLAIGPGPASSGAEATSVTIEWTGASPALIALAQDPGLLRARLTLMTVELDPATQPPTRIGQPFDRWAGLCDMPAISADPADPRVSLTAHAAMIDLGLVREILLTDEAQRAKDPEDTGGSFVAGLSDEPLQVKAP
jgi:hypothetical protein